MKIVELPVGGGNAVLTGYLLDASQEFANITARPAVLVLPGGGYALCSDREAEPIAMAYLAQGFHAFVLRYTVGTGFDPFPSALAEAEQALETLRAAATAELVNDSTPDALREKLRSVLNGLEKEGTCQKPKSEKEAF